MKNIISDRWVQEIIKKIELYDGLDLAVSIASLNTLIEHRDTINSIIILTHIALVFGKGTRKATPDIINECYILIKKSHIGQDDPQENIFVNNICSTTIGNSYVLEGIWNNSAFYAQIFVDIVDSLPKGKESEFCLFKQTIYSMLKVSHLMCIKASLKYNNEPAPSDNKKIFPKSFVKTKDNLVLTLNELEQNNINIDCLKPFICSLDDNDIEIIKKGEIGNTLLEQKPLHLNKDILYILNPTSIPMAIISVVINFYKHIQGVDGVELLYRHLLKINRKRLLLNPFILKIDTKPESKRIKTAVDTLTEVPIESYLFQIDKGIYFNLLFVFDPFDNLDNINFLESSKLLATHSGKISANIHSAREKCITDSNFHKGYSLIVLCGFGRPVFAKLANTFDDWDISSITNSDFYVLSWLDEMCPKYLFRVKDAERALKKEGVIMIPSAHMDMLNTIGIIRENEGSLVNPNSIGNEKMSMLITATNANRNIKYDVISAYDMHMRKDINECWKLMRIGSRSFFKEDRLHPIYVDMDTYYPNLILINNFDVWVDLKAFNQPLSQEERLKFVTVWVKKTIKYLCDINLINNSFNNISLIFIFEGKNTEKPEETLTLKKILEEITYEVDREEKTAHITFTQKFDRAYLYRENIADQAIVFFIIQVIATYLKIKLTEDNIQDYVNDVITDKYARQVHAFEAISYRDFIQAKIQKEPLVIPPLEINNLKFGLAWRVINRNMVPIEYHSIDECSKLLNNIVFSLITEIRDELKFYNRVSFIEGAFESYEANAKEDIHWDRTLPAMLAVHDDKNDILQVTAYKKFQRNGGQRALRLLIEIALCDCPLVGGKEINDTVLANLMAKISFVEHFGNLSDAIFYHAVEAWIRITSLGDIHNNPEFEDDVVIPFGQNIFNHHSKTSGEHYDALYKKNNVSESKDRVEDDFLSAWEDDLQFSFQDLCLVIRLVEIIAKNQDFQVILDMTLHKLVDEIQKIEEAKQIQGDINVILDFLLLKTRNDWLEVPEDLQKKEVFPWLYRRRMSIIMKPILLVDNVTQRVLISVPFLQDSLNFIFHSYYYGTLRDLCNKKIEKKLHQWKGKINNKIGTDFNGDVAQELIQNGWEAVSDIKVTQLLNKLNEKLDIDYGDVDTLAWDKRSGRVLIIECKNLQFKKTSGEIAEQISAFRGLTDANGKRDLLKRHLDRVHILKAHHDILQNYLKIDKKITIESHIVFKGVVPMKYSMQKLNNIVNVHFFHDLELELTL